MTISLKPIAACLIRRHRGNKMNTTTRISIIALALASFVTLPALASNYVGGATFVARDDGAGQLLDAGGMMCYEDTGDGVGGACIAWDDLAPGQEYAAINDVMTGTNVAFQVCVDNNGDGLCGDTPSTVGKAGSIFDACRDTILFSHDDNGTFYNPLGPLPLDFTQGCAGGFPGWILFLCEGAHDDGSSTHTHSVTSGTFTPSTTGSGKGTFCGGIGELNIPPKPYVIADGDATPDEIGDLISGVLARLQDVLEDLSRFVDAVAVRDLPSIG